MTAILLIAVITRLPFMFEYVIDWDESTYILMAQSILNGNLLYQGLWDPKPPIGLLVFALTIAIFGKSIVAIRFLGLICVCISAWQIYRLVAGFADRRSGLLAAILFIVGMTAIEAAQATMLEVVTLPFLLGAALLLRHATVTHAQAFWAGVLIAAATLTRTNLGLVAPLLGLLVVYRGLQAGGRNTFTLPASYIFGGLGLLAVVAAPFVATGQLELFTYTIFETPGRRSAELAGTARAWLRPIRLMLGLRGGLTPRNIELALALVVWLPALLALAKLVVRRVVRGDWSPPVPLSVTLMAMGIVLSIGLTGNPWAHHLIQLLPVGAMLASVAIEPLFRSAARTLVIAAVALLCMAATQNVPLQYVRLGRSWSDGELMLGPIRGLLQFLGGRCGQDCRLYLLTDHLAYWLLDKPAPTRLAHPSNLMRREFFDRSRVVAASPEKELQAILATEPTYIVLPLDLKWLDDEQTSLTLHSQLDASYQLAHRYDGGLVYQRVARPGEEANRLASKRSYR